MRSKYERNGKELRGTRPETYGRNWERMEFFEATGMGMLRSLDKMTRINWNGTYKDETGKEFLEDYFQF